METATANGWLAEGVDVGSKYRLGARIAASGRQGVYETVFRGSAAVIKVITCESAREASALKFGFELSSQVRHSGLLDIYDFGEDGPLAWIVMERGEECLADILRMRSLGEEEVRQMLGGLIPALQFLREKQLAPAHLKPGNVFACGDRIRISSDRIVSVSANSDAQFASLILESLTGSTDQAGVEKLPSPFREIVRGQWNPERARRALAGETDFEPAHLSVPVEKTPVPTRPRYRKFAGLAIGGAVSAAALCVLLIRGARESSSKQNPAVQTAEVVSQAPAGQTLPPAQANPAGRLPVPPGWAVVGASFHYAEDADRRANDIRKGHSRPGVHVYTSAGGGSPQFVVVFASGLTEAQAKKQLARIKRAGAPRGTYLTRFD